MKRGGFTFIELLMALLIFATIAAAVQLTLQSGIQVFRRGRGAGGMQQEAGIAMDQISRQIRGIQPFEFTDAVFQGGPDSIVFPARIRASNPGDPPRYELGVVSFGLEPVEDGPGERLVWTRTLFTGEELPGGAVMTLLEPVEKLQYEYAGYLEEEQGVLTDAGGEGRQLIWNDIWEEEKIPEAIRVSVTFADPQTAQPQEWVRTLYPATGGLPFSERHAPPPQDNEVLNE